MVWQNAECTVMGGPARSSVFTKNVELRTRSILTKKLNQNCNDGNLKMHGCCLIEKCVGVHCCCKRWPSMLGILLANCNLQKWSFTENQWQASFSDFCVEQEDALWCSHWWLHSSTTWLEQELKIIPRHSVPAIQFEQPNFFINAIAVDCSCCQLMSSFKLRSLNGP